MRDASQRDRDKLDEYFTSVRDIEQRIAAAESSRSGRPQPDQDAPDGIPQSYTEYVRLMYDMLLLAFQTDSTRVATFMIAGDGNNRDFSEIGINDGHHNLTHHGNRAGLDRKSHPDRSLVRAAAGLLSGKDGSHEGYRRQLAPAQFADRLRQRLLRWQPPLARQSADHPRRQRRRHAQSRPLRSFQQSPYLQSLLEHDGPHRRERAKAIRRFDRTARGPLIGSSHPARRKLSHTYPRGANSTGDHEIQHDHRTSFKLVMKMKVARFVLAASAALTTSAIAGPPDPNFFIFLCFGQSNMEGGGRIEERDRIADKRFQVLADFDVPNRGWKKGNWYDAVPPLTRRTRGISLVDSFGRTMVANLPEKIRIGIVKVGVSGTKIELWDKDSFKAYLATAEPWKVNLANEYGGDPYAYLVELAKIAQKAGVIKGFLVHQGESNFQDQDWPKKMKKICDDLCRDLSLDLKQTHLYAGEVVDAEHHVSF